MAKGFKTGGRRPGSKNKATVLREQAIQALAAQPRMTPLEFLDGIINSKSPLIDPRLKVTAAGIAARYVHTQPKATVRRDEPRRNSRHHSAAGV
jgi:hypothetical protein